MPTPNVLVGYDRAVTEPTVSAQRELYALLTPTRRVYFVQRGKSRTSFRRVVAVFAVVDGQLRNVTRETAIAIGWEYDQEHDGIVTHGGDRGAATLPVAIGVAAFGNKQAVEGEWL
jgi:hypothetical protein